MPPTDGADAGAYADRTDEWLVERCRHSTDEAAFAEIVRRYRGPVFRLAVSVLGDAFVPEAEDVAQDVLVRVHQALGTFRGESRLGTWIYRIAFNQALSLKARTRFRTPHLSADVLADRQAPGRGPDGVLQERERRRVVRALVAELPDVYQAALRLHYWMGHSVHDIAELMDVPENTVKSYLFRARRLLDARLTERGLDVR